MLCVITLYETENRDFIQEIDIVSFSGHLNRKT